MSLPEASRIAFSKIIVAAPQQIALINAIKLQIIAEQAKAAILDNANYGIWDSVNSLVNAYQDERQYLSGQTYTTYTNTDIQNAAALLSGNYFYPGVSWTPTVPYALGRGLGKNTDGSNPSTITSESSYIATLTSAINSVLSLTPNNTSNRITGQTCPGGGSGAAGVNLTATTGFAAAVAAANTAASNWATSLTNQINALNTIISTDTNATRNAAAVAEKASCQAALNAANTWISKVASIPYTQATDLTQAQFNAATASSAAPAPLGLDPSNNAKFNPLNVAAIQSAITTRTTASNARTSTLSTYMGTYSQNSSTGALTSVTPGFYYSRELALQLRISLIGGSLITVNGLATALNAQDSQIASINNQVAAYSTLLACSQFAADATGTYQVNLLDTNPFNVGDAIYIVSDNADEIRAKIQGIDGKRITLTQIVDVRYLSSDYARLYKELQ